jgi:hypothetical protein
VRVLRWIGITLCGAIVALAVVGFAVRGCDGPLGPFPGGPLEAGRWVDEPVADWSFAAQRGEVELQLLDPPRSRTTWLVVHEGDLYIPCGYPNLRWLKQWPHEALRDGRARLRLDGRLYPVMLERVGDPQTFAAVSRLVAEKYGVGVGEEPDPETMWVFRLDPRSRRSTSSPQPREAG